MNRKITLASAKNIKNHTNICMKDFNQIEDVLRFCHKNGILDETGNPAPKTPYDKYEDYTVIGVSGFQNHGDDLQLYLNEARVHEYMEQSEISEEALNLYLSCGNLPYSIESIQTAEFDFISAYPAIQDMVEVEIFDAGRISSYIPRKFIDEHLLYDFMHDEFKIFQLEDGSIAAFHH